MEWCQIYGILFDGKDLKFRQSFRVELDNSGIGFVL